MNVYRPLIALRVCLIAACTTAVTCCGSTQSTTPSASTATASAHESTNFDAIPGEMFTPAARTDNGQAQAPVGGCVNLSGPPNDAVLTLVDCKSAQNTYKIVQRVNTPQECGDTDRSYYHNSDAIGQYTACLDLAWDNTSCIALGPPVSKVNCTDTTAVGMIKPTKVILDTTNLSGCTDGGYVHPQRRFTVCTQTQN